MNPKLKKQNFNLFLFNLFFGEIRIYLHIYFYHHLSPHTLFHFHLPHSPINHHSIVCVHEFFLCFFFYFFIVLLQLSQFSTIAFLRPNHSRSHSQFTPCCPCPWVIHTCTSTRPFLFFSPLSLLPSGHCHSVPCFHAVVLFCSFVCFVH